MSHLSNLTSVYLSVTLGPCRCCYQPPSSSPSSPCTRLPPPCFSSFRCSCAVRSPSGCLHVIRKRKQILYRYYIYIEMFFHRENVYRNTYSSGTRSRKTVHIKKTRVHPHASTHTHTNTQYIHNTYTLLQTVTCGEKS